MSYALTRRKAGQDRRKRCVLYGKKRAEAEPNSKKKGACLTLGQGERAGPEKGKCVFYCEKERRRGQTVKRGVSYAVTGSEGGNGYKTEEIGAS